MADLVTPENLIAKLRLHKPRERAAVCMIAIQEIERLRRQVELPEHVAKLPVAQLLEAFNAADAERFKEGEKAHTEAAKCKAEDDMYGWNFHEGVAGGMVWASIFFGRVRRQLEAMLKEKPVAPAAPDLSIASGNDNPRAKASTPTVVES